MIKASGFQKKMDLIYDLLLFLTSHDGCSAYYIWKHLWDKVSYEGLLRLIKALCEYNFLKTKVKGRERQVFITKKGRKLLNLLKK